MTPRVTAVVLTWNSAQHLGNALTSLRREAERVPTEIVVVDNGSVDRSLEIVAEITPEAVVLRNESNQGVAAARNQGVRAAHGDFVLFLDSDASMTPGSLEAMVRYLDAHSGVAVVGPKLVYPDGRLQYSCRRFPTVPGKLSRLLPLAWRRAVPWVADEEMLNLDRSVPQDVDYLIGACQLVRADVLRAVGGLDDRMFYGPEDVDFCLRVWRAGWRVCYLPAAVAIHAEQRITHKRVGLLTLRHGKALAYYFWKHRYVWRRPRVGAVVTRRRPGVPVAAPAEAPKRVKLLYLVTLSEWGGAQACVFALARGFKDAYDVTVGCGPGGPLVDRLRAEGLRVVEIPTLVRPPRPIADLRALWMLSRWIARERFTIVHCHSTKAGLLGRFAAKIAGVPGIVFTVHGWPFTGWWHPVIRATVAPAERIAARLSTAIICVCDHDRDRALAMGIAGPDKVHVVYNGVAPEQWLVHRHAATSLVSTGAPDQVSTAGQMANGALCVVSVGRLTQQKDIETLLQAWRLIHGPHRLALVGDGPSRPALELMIERHGLTGRVDLLGARDDVPQILRRSDLFVLSSRWEGLPLAVIEAMMSGLPVIATAVGGIPEQVVEGETGLLVPPGDPDTLARAVSRLLNDAGLRERTGAAGRRRALERFTEARMLRQTAEVYAHVLSGTA